jgi:hypothetical protein
MQKSYKTSRLEMGQKEHNTIFVAVIVTTC